MPILTGLSKSIILNSAAANQNAANFIFSLQPGMDLGEGEWRVSLAFYALWYSIENISAKLGNNQIVYTTPTTTYTVTFPDGGYGIQDITDYFNAQVQANNVADVGKISLAPFLTTTTQMYLTTGYSINLSTGAPAKMAIVLGFNPLNYTTVGITVGQNEANVTPFSNFVISIDGLIDPDCSYAPVNSLSGLNVLSQNSVIYQGSFNVPFGNRQVVEPQNPLPLRVLPKKLVTLNVKITDGVGNQLDFGQNGNYQNNESVFTLLFEQFSKLDVHPAK